MVTSVDTEVFQTPYARARAWATPAQGAALDELSQGLRLEGDGRLGEAYRRMLAGEQPANDDGPLPQARRRFRLAGGEGRRFIAGRFPDLGNRQAPGYAAMRAEAVAMLGRLSSEGWTRDLLAADDILARADEEALRADVDYARVTRFVRLAKSVILA